jgi:hypothetical protein
MRALRACSVTSAVNLLSFAIVSPLDSAAIQTSHNRTGQVWLEMASGLETNRESLARRLAYFYRAEYGCGRVLALMELVGEQLVLVQEDSSGAVESSTFASFDL